MNRNPLIKLIRSFGYALQGIKTGLRTQPNLLIHVVAAGLALSGAYLLGFSVIEFALVLLCCALVIGLELLNSALELLCDYVQPDKHEAIKRIKDMSAGAVLVAAIVSGIIGVMLFIPKLFNLY